MLSFHSGLYPRTMIPSFLHLLCQRRDTSDRLLKPEWHPEKEPAAGACIDLAARRQILLSRYFIIPTTRAGTDEPPSPTLSLDKKPSLCSKSYLTPGPGLRQPAFTIHDAMENPMTTRYISHYCAAGKLSPLSAA